GGNNRYILGIALLGGRVFLLELSDLIEAIERSSSSRYLHYALTAFSFFFSFFISPSISFIHKSELRSYRSRYNAPYTKNFLVFFVFAVLHVCSLYYFPFGLPWSLVFFYTALFVFLFGFAFSWLSFFFFSV